MRLFKHLNFSLNIFSGVFNAPSFEIDNFIFHIINTECLNIVNKEVVFFQLEISRLIAQC